MPQPLEPSILKSVKKYVNVAPEYEAFDQDIIMNINSALAVLNDVGVGPEFGFEIEDETAEWETLLGGDPRLNQAKTYVGLYVRLHFDPPQTAHALSAMEKQLEEKLWRLNVAREAVIWHDPTPALPAVANDPELILDGGQP